MGETVVVTGGAVVEWHTVGIAISRVQLYNSTGAVEWLPHINTPRMYHACGHYFKDDKVVTIFR